MPVKEWTNCKKSQSENEQIEKVPDREWTNCKKCQLESEQIVNSAS